MKLQKMLLGGLLLLLVMGMDVAAINMLFDHGMTVALVSVLLVLECLFMLHYHYHSLRKPDAASVLTRWNKRFQLFFLVLTLCCVGVFAADNLGVLDDNGKLQSIKLMFWGLFAGLVMLGAGLALYALLDEPDVAVDATVKSTGPAIQYGKAGYS